LLESSGESALVLGQLVPRLDTGVAWCELRPLRDHAPIQLTAVPALADDVPPVVERTPVLGEVLGRRLVRRMRGAEGDVGEERSVRTHALAVGDHPEELVDEIFTDVVAVLGPGGWIDRVVVGDELGVELIGLTLEEA